MKKVMIAGAGALLLATVATSADTDHGSPRLPEATKSVEVPFEDMTFEHTGYVAYGRVRPDDKTTPDIQVFDAYGKVQGGPHATIMKWPRGFKSVLHTHTGDYFAVIISGVMSNYRPGGPVKRLGAGSYWFQKGGEPHVTECYSEDCTAVIYQGVGFDAQFLGK